MQHKNGPTVVTFVPAPTEAALDLYRSLERQTWQELKDSVGKRTAVGFTFPDELARFRSGFADPQLPAIVHDVLVAVASSGISASVFQLLKTWVGADGIENRVYLERGHPRVSFLHGFVQGHQGKIFLA